MATAPAPAANARKAVVATDEQLAQHGARRVTSADAAADHDEEAVSVGAWTFFSKHRRMLDSAELTGLAADVAATAGGTVASEDHVVVDGHTLRLPAMVFGHDVFKFVFQPPGGAAVSISLGAADALACWAVQHRADAKVRTPLRVVQVPFAWSDTRRADAAATIAETGSSSSSNHNNGRSIKSSHNGSSGGDGNGGGGDVEGEASAAAGPAMNVWDWTFTSDYCCTVSANDRHVVSGSRALSAQDPCPLERGGGVSAGAEQRPRWQRTEHSGIDYALLRARDVPILFYDEVLLYQDDLEDCGDVLFEAKLRVMPHCWFVLSRFFLRVDGSVARIRDARLFHRFGDSQVHMDVAWKEMALTPRAVPAAAATHAPPPGPIAAAVPGAIRLNAPPLPPLSAAVLRNPAQLAEILPSINDNEGVHKTFTLDL